MPAPVVVQTQPPVSYPAVSAPPPMHYAPPLQVSVEASRWLVVTSAMVVFKT